MDAQLNLTKTDNDVWGFRLTGGAEYDVPFIVVHVAEDSSAERSGLKYHDVIVKVNGTSVVGLTHNDAHQLLIAAGNSLILDVKRDAIGLIPSVLLDDASNEEVSNIMQPYLENEEDFERQKETYFELIDPLKGNISVKDPQQLSATAVEQQLTSVKNESVLIQEEKKWSTFLQRPSNPKPICKQEETPKSAPYRVVIKKQPKKVKKVDFKDKNNSEETKSEEQIPEAEVPKEETEEEETLQNKDAEQAEEGLEPAEELEQKDERNDDEEENLSVEEIEPESTVDESEKETNGVLDKVLEEKLAEIQKQLELLSKLPSHFQSTIDALNKQLASIVGTTECENQESEVHSISENDLAEQSITEESADAGENDDQPDQEDEGNNENAEKSNEEDIQQAEDIKNDEVEAVEEDLEEEKRAREAEQELLKKQEKDQALIEEFQQRRLKQKPTLPLKPIERPIILPGGRRWSQPDDACPVVRQVKMSDEKIANTIETFSEVIVGKTKGINFLKYQPPPKNLDYLQRSDVFKLVHDMEPPVRGISSRASKILAERDYYPDE